jgi:hypothetical protein
VKEQFFGTEGILETERQYYQSHRAEDNDVVVKSKREITIEAVEAISATSCRQTPQYGIRCGRQHAHFAPRAYRH